MCWDPPVTPEIQMYSRPTHLDGIRVHCAVGSTKALYSSHNQLRVEPIQVQVLSTV